MRSYETVIIITPVLSEGDLKKTIEKFRDLLKKAKADIIHEEDWGMRNLAYEIQNKSTGYYHIYEYSANADIIAPFEVELSRDENIIRFLTSKLDKFAVEYNDKKKKGLIGVKKDKEADTATPSDSDKTEKTEKTDKSDNTKNKEVTEKTEKA